MSAAETKWERIDQLLEWGGEKVNPILVKEARQALKSNHFVLTFLLLLICAWGWSFMGILAQMPDIQFNGGGLTMLQGYFIVLLVPLLLVVPFAAFRSLASEREDGTFELMSITTLNATQIVVGKLASTLLQIMLYTSALAPCIAFTYMLRGVDVVTIVFVIYYTVVISVLLSITALLVATLSRSRHWQVLLSILLLLGLFLILWTWGLFVFEAVFEEGLFQVSGEPAFWLVQFALACGYVSLGVLMVQAAASRITFASDNRSTRQRITVLVQHAMLIGWVVYFFSDSREVEFVYVLASLAAIWGGFTGSLMIGESPQLSARVIRSLPSTPLGRILFTLLNPGSGAGYLFTCANLTAVAAIAIAMGFTSYLMGSTIQTEWLAFTLLVWSYVTGYLGVSRLVILALRRISRVPELLSIIIVAIMASAGIAAPLALEAAARGLARFDYTALQVTNWVWTLEQAGRMNMLVSHPEVVVTTLVFACLMLVVNALLSNQELAPVRTDDSSP